MNALIDYIELRSERGSCQCGQCIDAPQVPFQPDGHTADLGFFKVRLRNEPTADELRRLINENGTGEFADFKPLDALEEGKVIDYIALGAWIGDQGLAMQLMGMGQLLGLWRVLALANHPLIFKGGSL